MTNVTTKSDSFQPATDTAAHLFDNWFDPIEIGVGGSRTGSVVLPLPSPRRVSPDAQRPKSCTYPSAFLTVRKGGTIQHCPGLKSIAFDAEPTAAFALTRAREPLPRHNLCSPRPVVANPQVHLGSMASV